MSERTTINVSKDAHRAAKEAKKDGESWTEYLLRCTDEHPREDTARVVVEEIRDELGVEGDADIPTVVKSATATDIDAEAIAERIKKALGWGEGDTHTTATLPRERYELEDGQTWQDVLAEASPDDDLDDLTREVRKAQELAEQARDAAQRVEEGMGR